MHSIYLPRPPKPLLDDRPLTDEDEDRELVLFLPNPPVLAALFGLREAKVF
jgi:hypothetical protein